MEEHKRHLENVLKILAKDGLIVNESKCMFGVFEVTFCGFVITNGTIKMEPSKVAAVTTWLEPKTISELRGFLGFINFYRKFLRHIGGIAAPLTALLGQRRGSTPLVLSLEQRHAFEELKKAGHVGAGTIAVQPQITDSDIRRFQRRTGWIIHRARSRERMDPDCVRESQTFCCGDALRYPRQRDVGGGASMQEVSTLVGGKTSESFHRS